MQPFKGNTHQLAKELTDNLEYSTAENWRKSQGVRQRLGPIKIHIKTVCV